MMQVLKCHFFTSFVVSRNISFKCFNHHPFIKLAIICLVEFERISPLKTVHLIFLLVSISCTLFRPLLQVMWSILSCPDVRKGTGRFLLVRRWISESHKLVN
jgi:hypothetical protein